MVPMEPRFLIFGVAVVFLARVTGTETRDPLAAAFYSLDGEERNDFLNYFLAVGLRDWTLSQPRPPKFLGFNEPQVFVSSLNISKASAEKFENMNIPKESVRKLLEWTKSEFNLSTRNIAELVRHKKSSGRVRFPDIGELCCPW